MNRTAAAFLALGIEAGEHVGIWSMNVPEWVLTQLAAGRIGAVLVNVNPAYRLSELKDCADLGRCRDARRGAPFKGSNFVAMVESLCPEVAAATSRNWSAARFPRLKRLVTLGNRPGPGWWSWPELASGSSLAAGEVAAAQARCRPVMSTTSNSPRERPVCPRARCSHTVTYL